MSRLLLALLLLSPALVRAQSEQDDPRFAQARDGAQRLESLAQFLQRYVGDCGEGNDPACRKQAEAFRKAHQGKRLLFVVDEDAATMVRPQGFDPSTQECAISVVPLFPAGNYALSHGAPKKTDANGNPVMPLLRAEGVTPEDWNSGRFERAFSLRAVRVAVVFTPTGVWSLPRKGGGKHQGVTGRIEALQVSVGRTGEVLGTYVGRGR